jgi:hypothetical protein
MFHNGRQVRLQMLQAVPVEDGDSRLMLIDMGSSRIEEKIFRFLA